MQKTSPTYIDNLSDADVRDLLKLVWEEAAKDNSPYGRSDSVALYNIRTALGIPKYGLKTQS